MSHQLRLYEDELKGSSRGNSMVVGEAEDVDFN